MLKAQKLYKRSKSNRNVADFCIGLRYCGLTCNTPYTQTIFLTLLNSSGRKRSTGTIRVHVWVPGRRRGAVTRYCWKATLQTENLGKDYQFFSSANVGNSRYILPKILIFIPPSESYLFVYLSTTPPPPFDPTLPAARKNTTSYWKLAKLGFFSIVTFFISSFYEE